MTISFKIVVLMLIIIGIVEGNFKSKCKDKDPACVLESFGYSSSCVLSSLFSCQESSTIEYAITKDLKDLTQTLKSRKDGTKSEGRPRNCADLKVQGGKSGTATIYPYDAMPNKPVLVYCEHIVDGGGWVVIQRRDEFPKRENFTRTWNEYKIGFGEVQSEFWLGLDNIHALTSSELNELRIDMEDWDHVKRFAKYEHFYIADESDKYRLNVGGYSGDAGDSLNSDSKGFRHNGMMFTTYDNDNDGNNRPTNCAEDHKGAWWYNSCHSANLNALPLIGANANQGEGISWHTFRGTFYSLKMVRMMVRPAFNR